MAVDTRAKRASALRMGFVFPVDGAVSAADRLAAAWMYSGIAAILPSAGLLYALSLNVSTQADYDRFVSTVAAYDKHVSTIIDLVREV